jgi:hypothetical protein
MFHLDYFLALSLISSSGDPRELTYDSRTFGALQAELQRAALQLEIMDAREVRYIMTRPEDFASDLSLLRRRYRELADAPAIRDAERFPNREAVNELLAFNRAYRQHIGARQPVELAHWWEFRAALQETDQLYQIWDTVRDARCDYYYVTVRRQALKKLREMIGDEAYWNGDLPPHVPLWRFQEIN